MLSRPCGLWQITPAKAAGGAVIDFEYTGFPVFDHINGVGQILVLAQLLDTKAGKTPLIATVQHSSEWRWLEMRPAGK